jgi:hypothetical protein
METLTSLSLAALLAGLAMALLMAGVSRLGRKPALWCGLQALGLLSLKFALLVLGLGWMSRQPWFRAGAAALGIAIPMIGLVLWKGRPEKAEEKHA